MRKKVLVDWIKQNFWLSGLLLALFALSACETPNAMSVRAGLDPKYVDDHVRFRARYYYTVIQHCDQDGNALDKGEKTITLYRYTLTGKAPSLFTEVKFEAGLMPTQIVEKFGSKLKDYPENNNIQPPKHGNPKPKGKYCYDEVFISGPEGTIHDDDTKTLVLSMTTSARPLIQSLGALNNLAQSYQKGNSYMMNSVLRSNNFKDEEIIVHQVQSMMLQQKIRMAEEGFSALTPDQAEEMMRSICGILGQTTLRGESEKGTAQCPDPQ